MVQQPVEHGSDRRGVPEQFAPVVDGSVGREQRAGPLIPRAFFAASFLMSAALAATSRISRRLSKGTMLPAIGGMWRLGSAIIWPIGIRLARQVASRSSAEW